MINLFILFLTNYLLPVDSHDASKHLVKFLSNSEQSILITVVSIGVILPMATLLGSKKFTELIIGEDVIDSKMQYMVDWKYKTTFRIQSKDDGLEEYKRCKKIWRDSRSTV